MAAQYANLDGRRYVNQAFLDEARQAYPITSKRIPLGVSIYTGWTGKDEVLFVQQGHAVPDLGFEGAVYQVSFDPAHPECFEVRILEQIKHTDLAKPGRRASGGTDILASWRGFLPSRGSTEVRLDWLAWEPPTRR